MVEFGTCVSYVRVVHWVTWSRGGSWVHGEGRVNPRGGGNQIKSQEICFQTVHNLRERFDQGQGGELLDGPPLQLKDPCKPQEESC